VNLGPWEILIIAGVIILLFGATKMPKMARSLGQSMRILKAETKGMRHDEDVEPKAAEPTRPAAVQPQALPEAKPATPQVAPPIEQTPQANANKNAS
jgi:sec-independent protein translocase protein TatA